MKQASASFSIYFMIILPLSLCTSPWFYISSTKCILTSLLPHSPKQVLFSDCHICSLYTYVSFIGLQNLYLLICWIFLNENLCVDYEFSLWKILQLLRIFFLYFHIHFSLLHIPSDVWFFFWISFIILHSWQYIKTKSFLKCLWKGMFNRSLA